MILVELLPDDGAAGGQRNEVVAVFRVRVEDGNLIQSKGIHLKKVGTANLPKSESEYAGEVRSDPESGGSNWN